MIAGYRAERGRRRESQKAALQQSRVALRASRQRWTGQPAVPEGGAANAAMPEAGAPQAAVADMAPPPPLGEPQPPGESVFAHLVDAAALPPQAAAETVTEDPPIAAASVGDAAVGDVAIEDMPIESAASESAASEVAKLEDVPSEDATSEDAATEDAASDVAPSEDAPTEDEAAREPSASRDEPASPEPPPPASAAGETAATPVAAIAGFGPGMALRLKQLGFHSAADLADADPAQLRQALGNISRLLDVDAWIENAKRQRAAK